MEYRLSNDARNTTPWFSVVRNKRYLPCSRITGVRDGCTFLPRGALNNPVLTLIFSYLVLSKNNNLRRVRIDCFR